MGQFGLWNCLPDQKFASVHKLTLCCQNAFVVATAYAPLSCRCQAVKNGPAFALLLMTRWHNKFGEFDV